MLSKARVVRLTERHGAVLNVIAGVRSVSDLREIATLNPNLRTLGFVEDVGSIVAARSLRLLRLLAVAMSGDYHKTIFMLRGESRS